jgi:catalase
MNDGGKRYITGEELRMSVSLNLDFEQVKALVQQLSPEEKQRIEAELRRELAGARLERLQEELKDAPISEEEIAEEVKEVRRERAEKRRAR